MTTILNLAPVDPSWQSTGAMPRPLGVQDWHMEAIPKVASLLSTPSLIPSSFDSWVSEKEWPIIYNQDGIPACVAHSEATIKSAEDWLESSRKELPIYDAMELHYASGGTATEGTYTDPSLRIVRDVGLLDTKTQRRRRIEGYAFAPRNPEQFRLTIAAALATTGGLVMAMLLPRNFTRHSSGDMTSGYHQVGITGYTGLRDDDEVFGPNSWGDWFGEKGFYGVTWRHIFQLNFQDVNGFQHAYAYTMIDAKDFIKPPIPEPLPTDIPDIKVVEYIGKKLYVRGVNFHSEAELLLNEIDTNVMSQGGTKFVYKKKKMKGSYSVTVVNPKNVQSKPFGFVI